MQLILLILASAIIAGLAFWVQALIYEAEYEDERTSNKMKNEIYDVLKKIAQLWLPAIGTLYFALAQIWGLPYAEQIVGTITAVDAFLGVVLGVSTYMYNKGNEEK